MKRAREEVEEPGKDRKSKKAKKEKKRKEEDEPKKKKTPSLDKIMEWREKGLLTDEEFLKCKTEYFQY